MSDWNAHTITEFRANEGRVGGVFEGAPIVLAHHRGRNSGRERVTPMMYLPDETDPDVIYVFASKGGAPTNPAWYHNLRANPVFPVEVGTETFEVRARVAEGEEREGIWSRQKQLMPGFAEYEQKTSRQIPVVILERV